MTKSALITGSSAGVGMATAKLLAEKGFAVFASMRNLDKGKELKQWSDDQGFNLELVEIDVTDDASVKYGINSVLERVGQLDVFVNNAGIVALGSIEDTPFETTKNVFETNYFGALRCMKEIVPHFRKKEGGRVVFVSSQSGKLAQSGLSTYCSSKWALECLAEVTAAELAPFGGEVSIIQPGGIMSPLQQTVEPFPSGTPYQQVYDRFMQWNAVDYQECAVPEDIADSIFQAIDGQQRELRKTTDFAGRNVAWRASMTDEDWLDLYRETDKEKWESLWIAKGGVDLTNV